VSGSRGAPGREGAGRGRVGGAGRGGGVIPASVSGSRGAPGRGGAGRGRQEGGVSYLHLFWVTGGRRVGRDPGNLLRRVHARVGGRANQTFLLHRRHVKVVQRSTKIKVALRRADETETIRHWKEEVIVDIVIRL
jgi:hypothetical protein